MHVGPKHAKIFWFPLMDGKGRHGVCEREFYINGQQIYVPIDLQWRFLSIWESCPTSWILSFLASLAIGHVPLPLVHSSFSSNSYINPTIRGPWKWNTIVQGHNRERERERERGKQCLVEKVKVCLSSVTVDEILQFNSFQKDFYNFWVFFLSESSLSCIP